MKKLRLLGAACACLAILSFNVNAALLTQNLNGVVISGTTYNVTFVQDNSGNASNSYNAIQTAILPSPLITFTDDNAATAAVEAILAVTGLDYDWTPGSDGNNGFRVPFSVSDPNYSYRFGDSNGTGGPLPSATDLDEGSTYSFATFTAVPVPAAVWLFGSGLFALAGIARRKKTT